MNAFDLDPHFLLPAWQALVRYFRAYRPVVQSPQQLDLPLPKERRKTRLARGWASSESYERPRRTARAGLPAGQGRAAEKATQSPNGYSDLERRLPLQPSP